MSASANVSAIIKRVKPFLSQVSHASGLRNLYNFSSTMTAKPKRMLVPFSYTHAARSNAARSHLMILEVFGQEAPGSPGKFIAWMPGKLRFFSGPADFNVTDSQWQEASSHTFTPDAKGNVPDEFEVRFNYLGDEREHKWHLRFRREGWADNILGMRARVWRGKAVQGNFFVWDFHPIRCTVTEVFCNDSGLLSRL